MINHALQGSMLEILRPALIHPDKLRIEIRKDGTYHGVICTPDRADMPRLIGKGGDNFRAVQAILVNAGARARFFVTYHVNDPAPGAARIASHPPVPHDPHWEPTSVLKVAKAALGLAKYATDVVTLPPTSNGNKRISVGDILQQAFADGLARWLHVVARSEGGHIDCEFRTEGEPCE